jgi:hypothetical protein
MIHDDGARQNLWACTHRQSEYLHAFVHLVEILLVAAAG